MRLVGLKHRVWEAWALALVSLCKERLAETGMYYPITEVFSERAIAMCQDNGFDEVHHDGLPSTKDHHLD
jgi:hypothetical protein